MMHFDMIVSTIERKHTDVFSEVMVCKNGVMTLTAYGAISVLIEADMGHSKDIERLCCSFCQDGSICILPQPLQIWVEKDYSSVYESINNFLMNIRDYSQKLLEKKYVNLFKRSAEVIWSVPYVSRNELMYQIEKRSYITWQKEITPGFQDPGDLLTYEIMILLYDRFVFRIVSQNERIYCERIMLKYPHITSKRGFEEYIFISHGYIDCDDTIESLSDLLEYINLYCRTLLSDRFLEKYGSLY